MRSARTSPARSPRWSSAATGTGPPPEQRLATIADVRNQVSRPDAGISAPALTDAEAQRIFDSACEPQWAQGLRLYKLYAKAAGFAPLARALEP